MRNLQSNFFLSCDWLQIHVKAREDFMEIENPYYRFQRSGQSKVWRNIYDVIHTSTGVIVAQYCTDATVMKPFHGVLKIMNNQLYCNQDLKGFVKLLLQRLQMRFISITRFDIAFDFQKFRGYDPMIFIKDFVTHKIVRVGGSQKTAAVMFKQKNRYHDFQTLYFGSKKSDIQIKMYNKTEELKAYCKPYINSIHKDTFKNDLPVWRLEFSIYSLSKAQLENHKGQLVDYNNLDILDIHKMYGIFIHLFNTHFNFRKVGKAKRIARMRPITLWFFEMKFLKLKLKQQNEMIKISSRSERIFLKNLSEITELTDSKDDDFKKALDDIFEYAVKRLNVKGGKDRYGRQKPEFIKSLRKYLRGDRNEKTFLSKLKKILSSKDYDDSLINAGKEIAGKIVSEYQLQDFAIQKDIPFAGFEKYIFNVREYMKIKGNEDRLDIEFTKAIENGKEYEFFQDCGQWIKLEI